MALEITKEDLQQLHANGVVSSYKRFEAWKRDFCENTQNLLHGKTLKIFWMQLIPLYTLTAGKGFAVVADEIDGINIAVDESAQGVTVAAQSTSELVDALSTIKAEADTNQEISKQLQEEVKRFKNIQLHQI